jgi:hypothetical protein
VSDWKVVLSSQFRDDIIATNDDFSGRIQKVKKTGDAEKIWRRWEDFQIFASTAFDLEEGLTDPSKVLRPHTGNKDEADTYVLKSLSEWWTGSFSADTTKKTYYGIRVYRKPA